MNLYLKFFLIVAVTVLLDQISKAVVLKFIPLYENLEVIPGFFSITHIRNTGVAFGLLAGQATGVRTVFFLGMSGLALGVVLYLHAKMAKGKPWVAAAFSLIFGGAVGNLVDRVRFGEVVDFLDFYVGTIHWPAFNVADSAITIGVGILCISMLQKKV